MKKTERIMHRAPRSAARASRARTAMCDSNGKCVTGSYFISVTQLPYIFQSLTPMCDSFSEFILELVSNTVLFLKKNFNSKLPDTPDTHLWNYYKPSLFVVEHPTHTPFLPDTHLTHMALFLTHTKNIELNVDRISRISSTMSTNHENRLSLRVHRSFWRSL